MRLGAFVHSSVSSRGTHSQRGYVGASDPDIVGGEGTVHDASITICVGVPQATGRVDDSEIVVSVRTYVLRALVLWTAYTHTQASVDPYGPPRDVSRPPQPLLALAASGFGAVT